MGKSRKKRGSLPPFVPMTWELLNSRAFIELCHLSRAALPYFLGKVKTPFHDPSRFNTPFSFPYSEAKRLGFPTSTFAKATKELVAHGFIDPYRKGGCYGDLKVSNQFLLSVRWKHFGTAGFEESDWSGFIQRPKRKHGPLRIVKAITSSGEMYADSS